jgi:multiple sugar transport system ATP-binding protein
MATLQLENLSKRFGGKAVLNDVSLELRSGECLVVFGPSGCGKTTLLRLVAGILEPDAGDVLIDGQSVSDQGPESRGVAMAFQNFALYPHLSAYENIASPLRARGLAAAEIDAKVHEVAKLIRIDHVLDHLPRQLSNGQKQRTSLARSLVHGPKVLLLDDPLRNVDAKVRYEMRLELPRVFRRFGSSVIYVTQDYKEAMALGDRVGVLLDGRFGQLDVPARVYREPQDIRVANLFGDPPINLLAARPRAAAQPDEGGGEGVDTEFAGHALALPDVARRHLGRDCLLGVRPEDIHLHTEPAPGRMPLQLEAVTPFNVRSVMLLRAADGTELLASTTEDHPLHGVRERRAVWATIDRAHALLFDRASGERL